MNKPNNNELNTTPKIKSSSTTNIGEKIYDFSKDFGLPIAVALFGLMLSWVQLKSSKIQSAEDTQAQYLNIFIKDIQEKKPTAGIFFDKIKNLETEVNQQNCVEKVLASIFGFKEWKALDPRTIDKIVYPNDSPDKLSKSLSKSKPTPTTSPPPSPKPLLIPSSSESSLQLQNYTIYIQYRNQQGAEEVNALADYLRNQGFTVPNTQYMGKKFDSAFNPPSIRYYDKDDKIAAERLQREVKKRLPEQNIKTFYLGDKYHNIRKGVIELWINL